MDYIDRILKILEIYKDIGVRGLDNGTRLIGHVPHVAPEAWFHQVYAPMTSQEACQLELELGFEPPSIFLDFLMRANGVRVFSGHLYICGLRANFSRRGDAAWQPFSILTPNLDERPRNAKGTHFFVGGYQPDGSRLYIDLSNLRVYLCSQRSAKPLHDWPSFEVMLESEVQRLSTLFDRQGRLLNPGLPTVP